MRKRTLAWLALSATALLVLGGASLASGGGGGSNAGSAASSVGVTKVGTNVVFSDAFGSPFEAHQYTISTFSPGTVKMNTRDCCIGGDKWVSTLIDQATNATIGLVPKVNAKAGNGNTSTFTGRAKLGSATNPFSGTAKGLVTYGDGVDLFGAGLEVNITCSGGCSVSHDF